MEALLRISLNNLVDSFLVSRQLVYQVSSSSSMKYSIKLLYILTGSIYLLHRDDFGGIPYHVVLSAPKH